MPTFTRNPNLECSKIIEKFKNLGEYHDVMVKLGTMKDQPDCYKVNYILEILKKHNLLPDAKELAEDKNDNKSEEIRKEGNSYFRLNPPEYLEALKEYNKSLCFAISKDNQSFALSNRSLVFFKLEMFRECLESIRLAREVGIPQGLEEKLKLREALCREELRKVSPEKFVAPKISMPINKKMPFLAQGLELREDQKFGRHVITTKKISAGSIIAIKEPFCKTLGNSQYVKCNTCSAEVPHLLMPCSSCTQTMFCSNVCKEKAYKDLHAIECLICGPLYKIFDNIFHLALRMTIKAFLAFPDCETMSVALDKIDKEQKNVFSYDWSQELSLEDLYTPIRTLMIKTPEKVDHIPYIGACLAFNLLKYSCPIFSQRYLTSTNADNMLKNLMYRHLQIIGTNYCSCAPGFLTSMSSDSCDYEQVICGFNSLLNHSCAPNVAPVPMGASYGIAAIKSIAAGEQIFTNYGYSFDFMAKAYRQEELFKYLHFHCICQACTEDFPMLYELPMPDDVRPIMQMTDFLCGIRLERFSLDYIGSVFRTIVPFLKKFSHRYPIRQLCEAEMILFTCLHFLCGNVPLKIREKIREMESLAS